MSSSPVTKKDEKKRVSKEKLRTIMEAASALTALGDEESAAGSRPGSPASEKDSAKNSKNKTTTAPRKKKEEKRFLPDHKKPDAALTFPEKVRFLLFIIDCFCVFGFVRRVT